MISIIFTILFALGSAYYDSRLFKSGMFFTNHFPRFIFRAVIVFLISYLFTANKDNWLYTFLVFLLNSAIFYFLFDYALNFFWGKPILRIGQVAIIDKIWLSLGGSVYQLIFKIVFVVGMAILLQKCNNKSNQKFGTMKTTTYICA